jgi:hypothetical protein
MKAIVCGFFLLLLVQGVHAQDLDLRRLSGLAPKILVVVEDPPTSAVEGGLTKSKLQTEVELRLRKAGFHVATAEARGSVLDIQVTVIKLAACVGYAFVVAGDFARPGAITNPTSPDGYVLEPVTVWSRKVLGTDSPDGFAQHARRLAGDLSDLFLNDFLAANPVRR